MLKKILVIFISITLVGCCGFKLRGSHTIPAYLKTIYITPDLPYDPFQRALRARLTRYKVKLACEPGKNIAILELSQPAISEQALAWGPDGQVQRFKYILTVSYTLITRDVKYSRTITRTRELSRSNNQLLSNESEKQVIHKELLDEAVNELLRQITSTSPHNAAVLNDTHIDNNPC